MRIVEKIADRRRKKTRHTGQKSLPVMIPRSPADTPEEKEGNGGCKSGEFAEEHHEEQPVGYKQAPTSAVSGDNHGEQKQIEQIDVRVRCPVSCKIHRHGEQKRGKTDFALPVQVEDGKEQTGMEQCGKKPECNAEPVLRAAVQIHQIIQEAERSVGEEDIPSEDISLFRRDIEKIPPGGVEAYIIKPVNKIRDHQEKGTCQHQRGSGRKKLSWQMELRTDWVSRAVWG